MLGNAAGGWTFLIIICVMIQAVTIPLDSAFPGIENKLLGAEQGHSRAIENEMEKMSGVTQAFRPKVRFSGSEWARRLRLFAFLSGNGTKSNGHRQTLGNRPCVPRNLGVKYPF